MSVYQKFLDEKVEAGLAPGFSAVVFDNNKQIFTGASGLVSRHPLERFLFLNFHALTRLHRIDTEFSIQSLAREHWKNP